MTNSIGLANVLLFSIMDVEHDLVNCLKVQSCKWYNNKYMFALTQIANTDTFAFIDLLVFKLLSRKVLFINRKDNRNCKKVGYFLRK